MVWLHSNTSYQVNSTHFSICRGLDIRVAVIIRPCLSTSSPSFKSESISWYINKPRYVIDTDISVISCRRPGGLPCRFYMSEIRNHLDVTSRRDVTSRLSLSGIKYAILGYYPGGETKLVSLSFLSLTFSETFLPLLK